MAATGVTLGFAVRAGAESGEGEWGESERLHSPLHSPSPLPLYSVLNTTIGSDRVARLAGR